MTKVWSTRRSTERGAGTSPLKHPWTMSGIFSTEASKLTMPGDPVNSVLGWLYFRLPRGVQGEGFWAQEDDKDKSGPSLKRTRLLDNPDRIWALAPRG